VVGELLEYSEVSKKVVGELLEYPEVSKDIPQNKEDEDGAEAAAP
jgi:hypothetical protein